MSKKTSIPNYKELFNPLITALNDLGGSGTIEEIDNKIAEILKLPNELLDVPHGEKDGRTEFEYQMAWARTYLKDAGLIDNSARGVWALVSGGLGLDHVDPDEIVRNRNLKRKRDKKDRIGDDSGKDVEDKPDWKNALREILTKLSPAAFERLVQRMLRESGFIQVEVTGRSGDGGIDGKGILRLNGLISFHVDFQCKRYIGSVSPSAVRDFRGGMVGHADKGLIVTTGTFTKDAMKEATRPGATAIDLIDGEQFMEKLKELGLGVATRKVEEISVDDSWFEKF